MRVEDLRHYHRAEQFRPFCVRVSDGREYYVPHPEFLAISPTRRTVIIYRPDGLADIIDTMMITSIHISNGKTDKKRRGPGKK